MLKEGLFKIQVSKSKTFAIFCSCFLVGVAVASIADARFADARFNQTLGFIWLGALIIIGVMAWWYLPWSQAFWIFLGVCVSAGAWRYVMVFPPATPLAVHYYAAQKVTLTAVVDAEPDVRIDGVRYIVAAQALRHSTGIQAVTGRVSVKYNLYPRFQYGDVVKIECTLELPKIMDDKTAAGGRIFRYDLYLARYGIFSTCEYPRIEKIGDGAGNYALAQLLQAKNSLATKITKLWPEPEASFMAGLLYGYRGGLGALGELFSRTGVTHIVAISGFNITIIATILINTCVYLCVPRQRAFWLVTLGIVGFVIFTGASASVVRAGVMGIIALLAKYVGRSSRIGNVLLLAAVTMVVQNPLVLMSDAGFQLSFLSTLGLVYLSPLLEKFARRLPEFLGLRENIVSTLAAIAATLPLILYQFGRLSLVAPVVNVLILWIIPWLMLAGVAAVVLSFVWWPLGAAAAWVGWLGMEYVIIVVRWGAALPFAAVDWSISVWAMVAAYCGMIYAVRR